MPVDRKYRIGIAGIYHESNTFYERPTTLEDFKNGHLCLGDAIISDYEGGFHEISGILKALQESREPSVEVVPIMYAAATPGGIITSETAHWLIDTLLQALERAGPLDGLMVVPHGAAVCEYERDYDGYWLKLVRNYVGTDLPIMGTLDPHANLSPRMVAATDALIAYKTNPHVDQRVVGAQAAKLMIGRLTGRRYHVTVAQQPCLAISIEQQNTSVEPCLSLYQLAAGLEAEEEILSVSILLGFPYADVEEMGTSIIVVANRNSGQAQEAIRHLRKYLREKHQLFTGEKVNIAAAIGRLPSLPKPILLLDMGDNVGGGSPADGTFLLQALEPLSGIKSFVCLYDPESVEKTRYLQSGESVSITVGAKTDDRHGAPVEVKARILAVVDGRFYEDQPRHGGQTQFDMGETVIIETTNDTTIMLTTRRIPPYSLQQLLHFGLVPSQFHCIVAKGVHAPLAAYAPVCKSIVWVDTPGITQADMRSLHYKYRRRPLYPFESITD